MNFNHLSDTDIESLIDNAKTAETRRVFQEEFDKRYAAALKAGEQNRYKQWLAEVQKWADKHRMSLDSALSCCFQDGGERKDLFWSEWGKFYEKAFSENLTS